MFWKRLPRWGKLLLVFLLLMLPIGGYLGLQFLSQTRSNSSPTIRRWFRDTSVRPALMTTRQACPGAPFVLPSDGFIGLLWRDPAGPYSVLRRHTGIDIFGDGQPGSVPIYAVYDGYLTRLDEWLSTVIIRHDDPLVPNRQIWSYYTHMAAADGSQSFVVEQFPPGTREQFVQQGTLLGYQGEYAGDVSYRVGLHVHLSLVLSEANGSFKNEAILDNTLDPSPYFGMPLSIDSLPYRPIQCDPSMYR